MPELEVIYTAAHGGFAGLPVPLGGGAAIFNRLTAEWSRTRPFRLRALTPAILGSFAPSGEDLVRFSERDYAAFCHHFREAATREILQSDPAKTVVLVNDVSEGPDFAALRDYRVHTIYHVDVVAYVAAIYLRGLVSAPTLARLGRLLPWQPPMARLVFSQQENSVRFSRSLVVPSASMKDLLLAEYPGSAPEKIHVLPWGHSPETHPEVDPNLDLLPGAPTLLTLSRISPEKGQDLLLTALAEWERLPDFPSSGLNLVLCGAPAYMMGQRYFARLQALAARLRRTRVLFPGHVTGARKQAIFRAADLYVFPSRHESYGLTLVEALAAGLPAVCVDHAGARGLMRPEFGAIVPARAGDLRSAIAALLANPARLHSAGDAARAWAATQQFKDTAARLAAILLQS
ncbi:MAG: glycosyltransferase family 4 protein [Bryobacter sp.]|nr:glycosyltransferase family 4 protein [Bryobacter sp.]